MLIRIGTFLLLIFISLSLCAGEKPSSKKLDPNIIFVNSAYDVTSGQLRAVVTNRGWEHVSSRLSLEWLVEGPKQNWIVQKSVWIKEFEAGVLSIGMPIWSSEKSEFSFSATHTYSGEVQQFILKPLAPGNYVLTEIK